jgi:hypothetical protein
MPRLAAEGIVGADAIFSCLGPAIEVFSRYDSVENVVGDEIKLHQFLELVWTAVSQEALNMIFGESDTSGLEPDAAFTSIMLWTLAVDCTVDESLDIGGLGDDEEEGPTRAGVGGVASFVLEYDAARKIAQGLGIDLGQLGRALEVSRGSKSGGASVRLLSMEERLKLLFDTSKVTPLGVRLARARRQELLLQSLDDEVPVEVVEWGIGEPYDAGTTLDQVHQAMILFGRCGGEVVARLFAEKGVGRSVEFWKLAQSLSALYAVGTDEKRWVDGVLMRKQAMGFG